MVICLERGADLHMAQLMPLPLTVSCLSKVQIDFTFLVLAHPGSPPKRAVKRVCVFRLFNILVIDVFRAGILVLLIHKLKLTSAYYICNCNKVVACCVVTDIHYVHNAHINVCCSHLCGCSASVVLCQQYYHGLGQK